jgi:2-succinyl-6-hydroxy-2,4-cyclohexadiene-1-carboxylate synthase
MYQWHFNLTGDVDLPPLLLLHGWMGNCEDYHQIVEILKSRFYCIAIDLPGHGKTAVIGSDIAYDFVNTAIGIMQLLDSLEIDRCAIAGYSLGGRLALYLALEFPDRFDRVMLESTSPGLATEIDRQDRITHDLQIIRQLKSDSFSDFVNDWYQQSIFIGIDLQPGFLDLVAARIKDNQPHNLAKSLEYAGLGMQPYLGDRVEVHPQPLLLIAGALDLKFVAIAQFMQRKSPIITVEIIPACSHNIHFQQPHTWIQQLLDYS